jgi:hypothetical protein
MKRRTAVLSLAILAFAEGAFAAGPLDESQGVLTPIEHRRPADQTFLTFPEWFLVHSPAEYAEYTRDHHPSGFPFIGHIGQMWSSYAAVTEATDDQPFNFGYHMMILVIASSTTVEYAIRAGYETLIGRVAEATETHGMTEEERFGAEVAEEYVDFINVRPWYEFDFVDALARLWTDVPMAGDDMIRKWERRYALTSEYLVKAVYGWIIGIGTRASYEAASDLTAVVIDDAPAGPVEGVELEVIERLEGGRVIATLPRYDAFGEQASILAARGVRFVEIAGNRGTILVSAIAPADWQSPFPLLFSQPILTRPSQKRVVIAVEVAALSDVLRAIRARGLELEHVYDY